MKNIKNKVYKNIGGYIIENQAQLEIDINGITVPIIYSGSKTYYPVSFIGDKVLLKDLSPSQLNNNGYAKYMKQFEIDYGENTGGIQTVYCIEKNGLKEVLKNSKVGRLSVEQKIAMNGLLKHLGMDTIDTGERFIDRLSEDKIKEYSLFIQDCISEVLKVNPNIKWQKCSKCGCYYPYDENFFAKNLNGSNKYPLNTICNDCWTGRKILNPNKELNKVYYEYGDNVYNIYRDKDVIKIYEHYTQSVMRYIPKIIHNKDDYLRIIKHYYSLGKFKIDELTIDRLEKELRLTSLSHEVTMDEMYKWLFEDDARLHPWKYPCYKLKNITFEESKDIFYRYIDINNIKIENVYDINYTDIIYKCGLKCYTDIDILGYVMKLYDNKYAAYKFKTVGQNYWKDKNNVNRAFKYYIEEDQKIPLEKIPLYLTLNNLQKNARVLYDLIHKKRFHKTLFEWVNDVYPDMFEERDFSVGSIRNYFDSKEEEIIYEYLKDEFKNVIYNKRNCDNTVEFKGMIPDFIVFTDNACYFIEYYGLYVPEKVGASKRISDYVKKTDIKIENYKTIRHRVIHLFPKDLDDNMSGLKDKLSIII